MGLSASERVFALVDSEPKVIQTDNQDPGRLQGHIVFDKVDFRYTDEEQVLRQFDLDIAAGETIALVGHTGAGKSSIGKLVARFYEFQGGTILIDGHDIRDATLKSLRSNIGMVLQESILFSGSIRDNILYGRPDASPEELVAAAQAARIHTASWANTSSSCQWPTTTLRSRRMRVPMKPNSRPP